MADSFNFASDWMSPAAVGPIPISKLVTSDAHLSNLRRACSWLNLSRGRAIDYVNLLQEYGDLKTLKREHVFSYFESVDLVEIFLLWKNRIDEFSGLRDHVRTIFKKGPILQSDEDPNESTNRSRNDAFTMMFAGRLLSAGIPVTVVEGCVKQESLVPTNADITFLFHGSELSIECKRLYSSDINSLISRVKEARKQIINSRRNGILVIDCSSLIHTDKNSVLDNSATVQANQFCSDCMKSRLLPKLTDVFCTRVVGIILLCSVPAVTPMDKFKNGKQQLRRDRVRSLLSIPNPAYSIDVDLMNDLYNKLSAESHRRKL